MAGIITTSLVVEFTSLEGDGSEGILKAELDPFPTGINSGKTSFVPGDSPGFLIYKTSNVVIDNIQTSEGSIVSLGGGSTPEPISESLTYTTERSADTSYPISSGFTEKQLGTNFNLGNVTHTESKVIVEKEGIGVLLISYTSNFRKYRLTGVPLELNGETSFSIVIYITGHTE